MTEGISRRSRYARTQFWAWLVVLGCLLLGADRAAAQNEPAWLMLERAKESRRIGRFDDAIAQVRRALEIRALYPEAELELGRIFKDAGDYESARIHYERSLDLSSGFVVPELRYFIYYELAGMYRDQGQVDRYVATLSAVTSDDPGFTGSATDLVAARAAYPTIFASGGWDRLVVLYRTPLNFAAGAHRQLGEHYVSVGDFEAAFPHLVTAALQVYSHAIAWVRARDIRYEFWSSAQFFEQAGTLGMEEVARFVEQEDLFGTLFFLAVSWFGLTNDANRAVQLWEIVERHASGGQWSDLAAARIAEQPSIR